VQRTSPTTCHRTRRPCCRSSWFTRDTLHKLPALLIAIGGCKIAYVRTDIVFADTLAGVFDSKPDLSLQVRSFTVLASANYQGFNRIVGVSVKHSSCFAARIDESQGPATNLCCTQTTHNLIGANATHWKFTLLRTGVTTFARGRQATAQHTRSKTWLCCAP
jgi:hypothetical protein